MVPGSSAVEQPAVNRLVAGSNPARGAISAIRAIQPSSASPKMRANGPVFASTEGRRSPDQAADREQDGTRQRSPAAGHFPRAPAAQAHAGHDLSQQQRAAE